MDKLAMETLGCGVGDIKHMTACCVETADTADDRSGSGLRMATERGMVRIERTTFTANTAARALYPKAGFEIEGVRRRSLHLDGQYEDEYHMGKIV